MDVNAFLLNLKNKLLANDNWEKIELSRKWTSNFPKKAGVYVLKRDDKLIYVGESGNLKGRMNDLLDSRHHSVRRTLGKNLYVNIEGFVQATTKTKFPDNIEKLLDKYISKNIKIAYLTVLLGRKELEEFIEKDIDENFKLNKRGKRKTN